MDVGKRAFRARLDRNLAADGAHYVELMAGVFTDNQPDFSWIAPGETKVFSQHWFPVQEIGPVCAASVAGAVSFSEGRLGVAVTQVRDGITIEIEDGGETQLFTASLAPGRPFVQQLSAQALTSVTVRQGSEVLLRYEPLPTGAPVDAAVEPALPAAVDSVDELYRIGVHLGQYRHATRSPRPYWEEALRRDPGHAPSLTALAGLLTSAGLYSLAEPLLRRALLRLTRLNANPADSSAHYLLGLVLVRLERDVEAYDAFGRALWNRGWRSSAGFQMALLDARAGRWSVARERLVDVLRVEPEFLQARDLLVIALRALGLEDLAARVLEETLGLDRLDWWARDLAITEASGLGDVAGLVEPGGRAGSSDLPDSHSTASVADSGDRVGISAPGDSVSLGGADDSISLSSIGAPASSGDTGSPVSTGHTDSPVSLGGAGHLASAAGGAGAGEGLSVGCDAQTCLDVGLEYARAGWWMKPFAFSGWPSSAIRSELSVPPPWAPS